jgi:hypothetical protein
VISRRDLTCKKAGCGGFLRLGIRVACASFCRSRDSGSDEHAAGRSPRRAASAAIRSDHQFPPSPAKRGARLGSVSRSVWRAVRCRSAPAAATARGRFASQLMARRVTTPGSGAALVAPIVAWPGRQVVRSGGCWASGSERTLGGRGQNRFSYTRSRQRRHDRAPLHKLHYTIQHHQRLITHTCNFCRSTCVRVGRVPVLRTFVHSARICEFPSQLTEPTGFQSHRICCFSCSDRGV